MLWGDLQQSKGILSITVNVFAMETVTTYLVLAADNNPLHNATMVSKAVHRWTAGLHLE